MNAIKLKIIFALAFSCLSILFGKFFLAYNGYENGAVVELMSISFSLLISGSLFLAQTKFQHLPKKKLFTFAILLQTALVFLMIIKHGAGQWPSIIVYLSWALTGMLVHQFLEMLKLEKKDSPSITFSK